MRRFFAALVAGSLVFAPVTAYASPYQIDVSALMAPPIDDGDPVLEGPVELPGTVPQTSYVKKGQEAPFEGVLLNPRAAAEVQVFKEQAEERCAIRVEREVGIAKAELQHEVDVTQAKLDAETRRRALEESINEQHIAFLSVELEETQKRIPKRNWGPVWFAGGVVSGVLVILAGAYAVKEVRTTP